MKTKLYTYLLLLFCCTITLQCKKTGYEEGPKRSLRSTEKKLNHTAWELEYYGVNTVDSFKFLPSTICCLKLSFSIEKEGYKYVSAKGISPTGNDLIADFETDSKDNSILILNGMVPNNNLKYNPYIPDHIINWKIVKFYPKESLWLRTNFNNKDYFLKFKRIPFE